MNTISLPLIIAAAVVISVLVKQSARLKLRWRARRAPRHHAVEPDRGGTVQ